MRWLVIPTAATVKALAGAAVAACLALLAGVPVNTLAIIAGAVLLPALAAALFDLWRSRRLWRKAPLRIERTLPGAFSLGVPTVLTLVLVNEGSLAWAVTVFDEVDPRFAFEGLPQTLTLPPASR